MILPAQKKLPFYQFRLLENFAGEIDHAVFTRHGGVSDEPYNSLNVRFTIGDDEAHVKKNRELLCETMGISVDQLVSANQTHSDYVQIIDSDFMASHKPQTELSDIDAFISQMKNVVCMIQVADCQAQIFYDPEHAAFGIIHAGWKGLVKDIGGATLKKMSATFGTDSAKVFVGIAPSLGPCCAQFSDPMNELPKNFHKFIDENKRVNLWKFSREQLQSHGIKSENIELTEQCTQCQGDDFFSYRRDKGITGRFGVVAYLK